MKWIAEGSIQLEPATNFAQIKDGNSGKDAKNNLPVKDGWNFLMHVYQPKIDDLNKYEIPIPLKVD